jgi:hypothetical protein
MGGYPNMVDKLLAERDALKLVCDMTKVIDGTASPRELDLLLLRIGARLRTIEAEERRLALATSDRAAGEKEHDVGC